MRKYPNESKTAAAARGVWSPTNTSRPWRSALARILPRKRTELRRKGYK